MPSVHVIHTSYTTRNIDQLEKVLFPITITGREGRTYIWLLWDGIKCHIYTVHGKEYLVERKKILVKDRLSGLFHRIPYSRGVVDGYVVWESVWTGSRFRFRFLINENS